MADTDNILSLCSGVGMLDEGLALGLAYLGRRPRVVAYAEREAYAATVLLARMADASLEPAPVWCGNFEDMDAESLRGHITWLCAGFPCQPWSNAGKGDGIDDERWLWPAIADIIERVQPRLVFLENVPGLVSGGGLNFVLDSLAGLGFDAEWASLKAAEVGAAHERERVFILAYAKGHKYTRETRNSGREACEAGEVDAGGREAVWGQSVAGHSISDVADAPRLPSRQRPGRQRVLDSGAEVDIANSGRSSEPRQSKARQRKQQPGRSSEPGGRCDQLADALGTRQQERAGERRNAGQKLAPTERDCGSVFAPGPQSEHWRSIIAHYPHLAPAVEPGVRVLADGLAFLVDESRADQLRCGGNGVVALQAACAVVELMRRAGLA